MKSKEIIVFTMNLFVITVNLILIGRINHEVLMINNAKPNQKLGFVRHNREFAITVIVITEFDCNLANETYVFPLNEN